MAGLGSSLVHNIYPAEFAAISRNITNQQAFTAQSFAQAEVQAAFARRRSSVDTDHMRPSADRDADGHSWGPPWRRKRNAPEASVLEQLAGEGNMVDQRA
jgi:hypothetical protein